MKQTIRISKVSAKLAAVALFMFNLSIVAVVFGQSHLSEINRFPEGAGNTITQSWGNSQVIYDQKSSSESYFILAEAPQTTDIYHKLTLEGYIVRDFVVYHDSVFFTGDNHHGEGFYGYFSLMALLNNGPVDITYRYLTQQGFQFGDMRCIKAFTERGSTNVMLIGNRKRNGGVENCLFNVSNDSTVSSYFHDDIEHFDDVEILDDYVVSAARKGGDEKPDPVVLRFLLRNSPIPLMYAQFKDTLHHDRINYAKGRVRLQRYSGTSCGLLYKSKINRLSILSFVVNPYPIASANVINNMFLGDAKVGQAYIIIDTLLDVGFNQWDNRLFALCDSLNGPNMNIVAKYTGSVNLGDNGLFKMPVPTQSVAGFCSDGFYASGDKSGELWACWQKIYYETDCMEKENYIFQDNQYAHDFFRQVPWIDRCSVNTETIRYSVRIDRYDIPCRYSGKINDR